MRRLFTIFMLAISFLSLNVVPVLARPMAHQATPETTCDVVGSLCDLLSLVPDILIDRPDVSSVFSYANQAAQLDALGIKRPTDREDLEFTRWSLATVFIPTGGELQRWFEFWPEEMGFSIYETEQSLVVGDPPDGIFLLRARFAEEKVVDAWTRLGYRTMSVAGSTIWKLRDDYELDLRERATTKLNHRNYAALVRSDVVVFTSNLASITSVVDRSGEPRRPLSERPEIADLVNEVGANLAAAWGVSGASIGSDGSLVLLSITPGGPMPAESLRGTPLDWAPADDMHCLIALKYPEGTDVEAVATEIAGNLENRSSNHYEIPYQEIFAERSVVADPEHSIVLIDLTASEDFRPDIVVDMLFRLDFGFLV